MREIELPENVRNHLLGGFAASEARILIEYGASRGNWFTVGAPMGTVLTWLWRSSPDATIDFLEDLVTELRKGAHSPIRVRDVLNAGGLRGSLSEDEFAELIERARIEVPARCGVGFDD